MFLISAVLREGPNLNVCVQVRQKESMKKNTTKHSSSTTTLTEHIQRVHVCVCVHICGGLKW